MGKRVLLIAMCNTVLEVERANTLSIFGVNNTTGSKYLGLKDGKQIATNLLSFLFI